MTSHNQYTEPICKGRITNDIFVRVEPMGKDIADIACYNDIVSIYQVMEVRTTTWYRIYPMSHGKYTDIGFWVLASHVDDQIEKGIREWDIDLERED